MSKTERLQVLIDTEQRERLEAAAATRGVSVASLVRTAIDVVYPPAASERARAAARVLAADSAPIGDADDLLRELDELRSRHA